MHEATYVGGYRLVARLGQGGMADVFLAFAEGPAGSGFAKLAVVKRLRKNLAEDPEFVAMLMDEGRVTARLSHPNIVQLLEVGQDGDDYFLAMEHLDGQPLHLIERRAQKSGAPLPTELRYAVVSDLLAGLHHAHELTDYDGTPLGIVHRDVTPHNVFVTYDGVVKVVDFGIAKAAGRSTETRQGIVKGKLRYMSPEQAMGGFVDRRCDIFAAGVLLYQAATGRRLWRDRDELEITQSLIHGRYDPSPRAVCPDVPEEIDAICRRALAFKVDDRYETAAEMQADLQRFVGARTATAHRELAKILQNLFEQERAKLRAVLESSAGESALAPPSMNLPQARRESTVVRTVGPAQPRGAARSSEPHRSKRPRSRANAKKRLLSDLRVYAAMGAALVVVFAVAVIGLRSAGGDFEDRHATKIGSDRQPLVLPHSAHGSRVTTTSAQVSSVRSSSRASPRRASPSPPATRPGASRSTSTSARAPARPRPPARAGNVPPLDIDKADPWSERAR